MAPKAAPTGWQATEQTDLELSAGVSEDLAVVTCPIRHSSPTERECDADFASVRTTIALLCKQVATRISVETWSSRCAACPMAQPLLRSRVPAVDDAWKRDLARRVLAAEPLRVVDAGALWGLQPELESIADYADAIGFDPDEGECERLNRQAADGSRKQRFLPYAVAGVDEERDFHVTKMAASSSLLMPNHRLHGRFPDAADHDVVESIRLRTYAFGPLLEREGVEPEFLKLDVHGVEPEVLDSLNERQWDGLLGVHVEVLFAQLYIGAGTFAEIDLLLRVRGFELYALKRNAALRDGFDARQIASRGQLMFGDALYLRNPDALPYERLSRLAVVAATFDHVDVACKLLERAGEYDAAALVSTAARRPSGLRRMLADGLIRLGRIGTRMNPGVQASYAADDPHCWL